jgi:hypothetical protein
MLFAFAGRNWLQLLEVISNPWLLLLLDNVNVNDSTLLFSPCSSRHILIDSFKYFTHNYSNSAPLGDLTDLIHDLSILKQRLSYKLGLGHYPQHRCIFREHLDHFFYLLWIVSVSHHFQFPQDSLTRNILLFLFNKLFFLLSQSENNLMSCL